MDIKPIDTGNRFMVGVRDRKVVLMSPPKPGEEMEPHEACALAAHLVVMADCCEVNTDADDQYARAVRALRRL
jgi:hypothetical protein